MACPMSRFNLDVQASDAVAAVAGAEAARFSVGIGCS